MSRYRIQIWDSCCGVTDVLLSEDRARKTLDYHCYECECSFSKKDVDNNENVSCPNPDCSGDDIGDFDEWLDEEISLLDTIKRGNPCP